MANNVLTEYLQFHGQENKIGCLSVTRNGDEGRIFIHHGTIVYADTPTGTGIFAIFSMLGWKDINIQWKENTPAPKITLRESIDSLLFQYAQLEDSGQADETTLRTLFTESLNSEINLRELKSYLITFEILNAEFNGTIYTLTKPTTLVGRGEDCDFIIPDGTVSTHHATITQEPNCIRITDLGSTNGTYINRELVTDSILQVGDELILGQISLRMSMKMQRHLAATGDTPSSSLPTVPHDDASRKAATLKIDATALRKKLADNGFAAKPKGPITWKNIEEAEKTRPVSVSLFSKLFKK